MNNDKFQAAGQNQSNKEGLDKKVGDKIERAGDSLRDKGADKLGKVVHDAGDKIEHMNDKKNY